MTSKLTREQTQQIIDAADAVITALAGTNDEVHKDDTDKMIRLWDDLNDRYAPPEVVRELARMALAAMDSEPVYQVFEPSDGVWVDVDDEEEMIRQRSIGGITRTLYTAPPAPVSINAPVVDGGEVYQIWSAGICQWVECDKSRYDAHASLPAQRRVLYTSDPESNSEPVAYMTYKGYLLHAGDPKLAEYSDPTPLYADPRTATRPAAPVAWL
ncbi:hypothetical protein [Raoultella ornithinolytica]|uniref:hypothetical protein n=1 Tax=Raoultella ornithinolytica TaxID=54291 RepID=UPI001F2AD6B8|nr:hypothetical protein [Raoultella ornithinolytica]